MKLTREQSQRFEEYFLRPDTPSRNSPVGNAMVRILAKYPGISFEDARTRANELLRTAAKARNYRGPVVLSAEEIVKGKNRIERAFRGQGNGKALSKTPIPGDSSYSLNHQTRVLRGEPLAAPPESGTRVPIAFSGIPFPSHCSCAKTYAEVEN